LNDKLWLEKRQEHPAQFWFLSFKRLFDVDCELPQLNNIPLSTEYFDSEKLWSALEAAVTNVSQIALCTCIGFHTMVDFKDQSLKYI